MDAVMGMGMLVFTANHNNLLDLLREEGTT